MVLKTVIAEDPVGRAHHGRLGDARDQDEGRADPLAVRSGQGWTVTWKGRGWDRPFDDYLALVRAAGRADPGGRIPRDPLRQVPSPADWRSRSAAPSTGTPRSRWRAPGGEPALPLEKDFSPTLAGDPLADERGRVLRWLARSSARYAPRRAEIPVRLALKLMNARFDDDFQLAMLDAAAGADALVCFNRLWDPPSAGSPMAGPS